MAKKKTYEEWCLPHLSKIEEWAKFGETEETMQRRIGVSHVIWNRWKKEHLSFRSVLKKGRQDLCSELKSTLTRLALGYTYEETQTIEEVGKVTKIVTTEKVKPPSEAAISMLLKNFDKDWTDNPQEIKIKRERLELQKLEVEKNIQQFEAWTPILKGKDVFKP